MSNRYGDGLVKIVDTAGSQDLSKCYQLELLYRLRWRRREREIKKKFVHTGKQ